jgi:hypothetical protein
MIRIHVDYEGEKLLCVNVSMNIVVVDDDDDYCDQISDECD